MSGKKEKKASGTGRLWLSAVFSVLLLLFALCALPRILPYERINVLYGMTQGSDRHVTASLPAGAGEQEVYLLMDNLLNIPETWLLVNGQRCARLTMAQTAGQEPVLLPAALTAEPGSLVFTLQLCYAPVLRLTTNTMTIPVTAEGA